MNEWERLQELLGRLAELNDEELAQLETDLMAYFDAVRSGEAELAEGTEPLELAEAIAAGCTSVRDEAATRIDAALERQAAMDRLAETVHAEQEGEPPGDGEGEPEGDGEGAEGTDAPAEGEPTAQPEGEGEGTDAATDAGAGAEPAAEGAPAEGEPVAVPASSTPRRPALPRISRVAARGPAAPAARPRVSPADTQVVITAGADVPGFGLGQEIVSLEQLAEAFVRRADGLRRMSLTAGSGQRFHVATIRGDYPDEQQLGRDAQANEERLRGLLGEDGQRASLTASGGLCAPVVPLYDVLTISDDARPARTALPGFGADRGGVRFVPPPRLGDYTSGVDQWTVDNDENPSDPATKPCVRVDCDEEIVEYVYAVTKCLEVGNFFARTYDERVQAILRLLGAEHARLAERLLLDKIGTDSTNVSAAEGLGTVRDTLAMVDRAVAAWHNRHRTPDSYRLELWLPRWWRDMARTDLAREMPGATAERLAVADAELQSFFGVRNVDVTYLMEGETGSGQDFGGQGAGALDNWPGNLIAYLFHPGAWLFLDGGMLDLGIVRDSTLNETNDLQLWSETFEGAAFRGIESLRINMDVCPSGLTQGTADFDPCTVGS